MRLSWQRARGTDRWRFAPRSAAGGGSAVRVPVVRSVGVVRERVGAGRARCRRRGVVATLPGGCYLRGIPALTLWVAVRESVEYVRCVSRGEHLARTYWFDLLGRFVVLVAVLRLKEVSRRRPEEQVDRPGCVAPPV